MLEERGGGYVVNVKDARWYESESFGKVATFEKASERFPHTGVHLFVLEPGKPNCRYHREDAQADFLVRSMLRGLNADLEGFTWYELPDPGWRYAGLLNDDLSPRPSYNAYMQMAKQLTGAEFLMPVDYGDAFEAYAFERTPFHLHVIWTNDEEVPHPTVSVPQGNFVAAYQRDGQLITPTASGADYLVPVGFSPVYIVRKP